jgi:hypothetical protein
VAAPSSFFEFITKSKEHNDGGTNGFISNDLSHFTSFLPKSLHVKQLSDRTIPALGYGLKLIQCLTTKIIIPLWPTYYMPSNPQCTFSPSALAHYLHYKITTTHLQNISITTSDGSTLKFPSIPCHSSSQLLDYHEFLVVRPKHCSPITHPNPTVNSATSETPMTRLLAHQRLCHNSDEVLDTMCWLQSLLGLPKHPFPPRTCPCVICISAKFTHPPKVKESSYKLTSRGQLLHIDFSFWNIISIRGFSSVLSFIDGKDRMLWTFPMASKRIPLSILDYFFNIMEKDGIIIKSVWVDEDGALANNTKFSDFLFT